MEKRIFLATKKENTVGVEFMPNEIGANGKPGKATRIPVITYGHEGQTLQGFADTRLSALHALITVMENTNTEELTNVVPVFVNQTLHEFLTSETYKFWLMTKKKQTGEAISPVEIAMLEKFRNIWKAKGDYFVIRDIFTCRINDKVKADPAKLSKFKVYSQQNDFYCRWCWGEIAKLYNESVQQAIASVSIQ